jgi:hypothetical protein
MASTQYLTQKMEYGDFFGGVGRGEWGCLPIYPAFENKVHFCIPIYPTFNFLPVGLFI